MSKKTKCLAMIIITCMMISCRPISKESYLKQYDEFIKNISENSTTFTAKDWENADEEYNRFNEKWYEHFKDELTWQERLSVNSYSIQYYFYKSKKYGNDFYDTYLKGGVSEFKVRIKYYMDNEMEGDLQKLLDEAKKSGDSTWKMVKKIMDDLEAEKLKTN